MTKKISTYLLSALLLSFASQAAAWWPDERGPDHQRRLRYSPDTGGQGMEQGPTPFGGYCPKRHADRYGARQPVHSMADARERLRLYFGIDDTRIKRIEERRHVFWAEISDQEGRPVELVIIDRRTGRIRSIR